MTTNFRKLSNGNYVGRNGRYYAFIFKRPHGGWCATVRVKNQCVSSEGHFTTSLNVISRAKAWADWIIEIDKIKQLK